MIHATAIVSPKAEIDPSVEVGPYAVIDAGVTLGPDCQVGPHVYLTGQTTIGKGNRFHASAVIGDAPQDLKYKDAPTRLRIGDGNVFREHVTVHRSNKLEEDTVVGSRNLFMASSHVGHNSHVGNDVIMANGAMLAGHVTIEDKVFISGSCMVHQFTRVGTLALMQGGAGISKDLPPYTLAYGVNVIAGLNVIGLKRAGLSPGDRLELRKLFHQLFRDLKGPKKAAEALREAPWSPAARYLLDFVVSAKKGVCTLESKETLSAEPEN